MGLSCVCASEALLRLVGSSSVFPVASSLAIVRSGNISLKLGEGAKEVKRQLPLRGGACRCLR